MKKSNGNKAGASVYDRRTDGVGVVSCTNGNLQLNPDGNLRRIDPYTGRGIMTPQGPKYKIRYGASLRGHELYIRPNGQPLEQIFREALATAGVKLDKVKIENIEVDEEEPKKGKKAKGNPLTPEQIEQTVQVLCKKYLDMRFFGGVLTSPINDHLTGPIQMGFSLSVDIINPEEASITRPVVTSIADAKTKSREMGKMSYIPFEVSVTQFSIDPFRAKRTGFSYDDYELFIELFRHMYDQTKSTTRFGACVEKIILFHHESPYGNAQAMKLYRRINIHTDVPKPSAFSDYTVEVDKTGLDKLGITVEEIDP